MTGDVIRIPDQPPEGTTIELVCSGERFTRRGVWWCRLADYESWGDPWRDVLHLAGADGVCIVQDQS